MKIEDGPLNNKVLDHTQEDILPVAPKNKRLMELEG